MMETESPSSTPRSMSLRTEVAPKDLDAEVSCKRGMGLMELMGPVFSGRAESGLRQRHQSVEEEADQTDGDDREDDVGEGVGVVLLPEEAADAGLSDQHFHRHDHQ